MSQTVWYEEVETALKSRLEDVVKLPNKNGTLKSVPCYIRKPDEDFKVEQYPFTSIYAVSSRRDEFRYCREKIIVDKDVANRKIVYEQSAIPYNLIYQLDFFSMLQTQMNDMLRAWISYHPDRDFNLPVFDKSGIARDCFALQRDTIVKQDILRGSKRVFHSIITYRIYVEIDENVQTERSMITKLDLIGG